MPRIVINIQFVIKTPHFTNKKSVNSKYNKSSCGLLEYLTQYQPDLIHRIQLMDCAEGDERTYLYCDPVSNLWASQPSTFVEQAVLRALRQDPGKRSKQPLCSQSQLFHVSVSNPGRRELLFCLACQNVAKKISPSDLDCSPGQFACRNGVFILGSEFQLPHFRKIQPSDLISRTTDWEYLVDLSLQHRYALESFLEHIFPIPDDHYTVMKFLSMLLCFKPEPDRSTKSGTPDVLCLTGHNQGRKIFLSLVSMLFGPFVEMHTKEPLHDNSDAPVIHIIDITEASGTEVNHTDQHPKNVSPRNHLRLAITDNLQDYLDKLPHGSKPPPGIIWISEDQWQANDDLTGNIQCQIGACSIIPVRPFQWNWISLLSSTSFTLESSQSLSHPCNSASMYECVLFRQWLSAFVDMLFHYAVTIRVPNGLENDCVFV